MKTTRPWMYLLQLGCGILLTLTLFSCGNELQIVMPPGPEGPAGKSSYEVWKEAVDNGTITWDKSQTEVVDYFLYLKGEKGDNGQDGKDGQSAYERWVAEVEAGNIIKDGSKWPEDKTTVQHFWEYLSGADGKNGSTPEIGSNGNWWIGGEDTGVPAKGEDGEDGQDGQDGTSSVVTIVSGYWHINGTNTGVPATGTSAYELWVTEVTTTGLLDPHSKTGDNCDPDCTTLEDFWIYLRGRDGSDADCQCTGQCTCTKSPKMTGIQPMQKTTVSKTLADEKDALATGDDTWGFLDRQFKLCSL